MDTAAYTRKQYLLEKFFGIAPGFSIQFFRSLKICCPATFKKYPLSMSQSEKMMGANPRMLSDIELFGSRYFVSVERGMCTGDSWKKRRGKPNSLPKWGEPTPNIPRFIFMFLAPGTGISCKYSVYREYKIKFREMAVIVLLLV